VTARVVAVLVVLLAVACSGGEGAGPDQDATALADEAQADGGGWGALVGPTHDLERFATLAEIGQEADAVLIGRATGVDDTERAGGIAHVRFEVVRAISDGDVEPVVVEVDVLASPDALEEQVAGFSPAVLMLREEEPGSYRLVNAHGLWTEQPDGGVVAPLVAEPTDDLFAAERAELAELEGLDELGDHLEVARRRCEPECGRGPRPTTEPGGG
jgi:hypothetical protein